MDDRVSPAMTRFVHMSPPVFRFAPSPNGFLHLGHAYSALLNARMAQETGGGAAPPRGYGREPPAGGIRAGPLRRSRPAGGGMGGAGSGKERKLPRIRCEA